MSPAPPTSSTSGHNAAPKRVPLLAKHISLDGVQYDPQVCCREWSLEGWKEANDDFVYAWNTR